MFLLKDGYKYTTYNGVNKNLFDWKIYKSFNNLTPNEHNLFELKFDLSDATLQGTPNHKELMPYVIPTYQVRIDIYQMCIDFYNECKNDSNCSSLWVSETKMLTDFTEYLLQNFESKTPEEKDGVLKYI
jgi:hypothetical protein